MTNLFSSCPPIAQSGRWMLQGTPAIFKSAASVRATWEAIDRTDLLIAELNRVLIFCSTSDSKLPAPPGE